MKKLKNASIFLAASPYTYITDWAFFTVQDGLNVGLLFGSKYVTI